MANSDSKSNDFSGNIDQINHIINLHINKWKLQDGIPSIGLEDIRQELLLQVYNQWNRYDQSRPLGNWLTTTICNRLKNLYRDNYGKFAKPCIRLRCESYLGGDDCVLFGKTCSDCPLYAEWEKLKKQNHDVSLPLTIESKENQSHLSSLPFNEIDFEEQIEDLKLKLAGRLTENEYKIFCALYLENKKEIDIIQELKFTSKAEGMRQCNLLKNLIVPLVKEILKDEELF